MELLLEPTATGKLSGMGGALKPTATGGPNEGGMVSYRLPAGSTRVYMVKRSGLGH